jgi:hypothetical protein
VSEVFRVVPTVFQGPGRVGDFVWMRSRPEFGRSLFVFNDNEEQFVAFERGDGSGFTAGGGNAVIRPWRGEDPPRSAGIPTGIGGQGYRRLDQRVEEVLARAVTVIHDLVDSGRYDTLVFSRDEASEMLGVGIFSPHVDYLRLAYQVLVSVRPGGPRWRPGGTGVPSP